MSQDRTRIIAGCMTGTSLDGLDVALVKIIGTGLEMQAELLDHHALSMPNDLRTTLMSLASGEPNEPIVYMRAARALGELHAEGVEQLMASSSLSLEGEGRGEGEAQSAQSSSDKNNAPKLDFITAHGQTIWHAPRDEQGPKSWQLFDPWPIVKRLNVPVCYDLRQADLIAGGEGAPLTPIADWIKYRDYFGWVVNLGGVMNTTLIMREDIEQTQACDVYPCNLLLDGLSSRLFNRRYDEDGRVALMGKVDSSVLDVIRSAVQEERHGGSLGREQFGPSWIDALCKAIPPETKPEDVLRSSCHAIALALRELVYSGPEKAKDWVVFAGGGARNAALLAELKMVDEQPLLTDEFAIPCEAREAMAFAVLGALSQDGVPISLPQVTGSMDPGVAGVWAGV